MTEWFAQEPYGVRFEWGPTGAERLMPHGSCLVIVDVLPFSTSVTVAAQAGTRVFPYPWRDERTAAFAERQEAVLAVGRGAGSADAPWTLSPAALRRAPGTARLVLPSPNGSTISATAAGTGSTVIAGCLRNATAVAHHLAEQGFGTADHPVAVIAAGERWPDGGLRPALEDLLGAGAIIAALERSHAGPPSPEATAASACYTATPDVASTVAACASGRELIDRGFGDDVAIAAETDTCVTVPVLTDGAFTAVW